MVDPREAALVEVAETLLIIEAATRRANQAHRKAALTAGCDDLARVLGTAARNLEAVRRDLFQGTYFSGNQPRLV